MEALLSHYQFENPTWWIFSKKKDISKNKRPINYSQAQFKPVLTQLKRIYSRNLVFENIWKILSDEFQGT